jgi:hypothetical protein
MVAMMKLTNKNENQTCIRPINMEKHIFGQSPELFDSPNRRDSEPI